MIEGVTSMNKNIIYVGLDVDDTQYHGSALDKNTAVKGDGEGWR